MMAAVLFAMAVPADALAAGPALTTTFGPLALVGLLLIIGGLLFLFGPDLLRRGSSTKSAKNSAATAPQASARAETPAAGPPQAGTLKNRVGDSDVTEGVEAEGATMPVDADAHGSQPATSGEAPTAPARGQTASSSAATTGAGDERPPLGEVYGPETCTEYVGGLTAQVLGRAKVFFGSLASEGEIDSAQLAERLGALPTELAGLLLTPLTRRAEAISVPAPFALGRVKGTRRRLWLDEDGVAARLERAIDREIATRAGSDTTADRNDVRQTTDRRAVAEDLASMRATGS
jgi:hypothetical protein